MQRYLPKFEEQGANLMALTPELPLGATYIIGTDAVIRYAFIDPDYRKRAEPDSLLSALMALRSGN